MSTVEKQAARLIYEGSVKRVWQPHSSSERLWFEFTDDYSVFDWGKMPDTIANKGRALAILGAYVFTRLQDPDFWRDLPQSQQLRRFDRQWLNDRFAHKVYRGSGGSGCVSENQPALTESGAATHFLDLIGEGEHALADFGEAARASGQVYMQVAAADVHRPAEYKIANHTLYHYRDGIAAAKHDSRKRRLIPLEIVFRFGMPEGSSLTQRLASDPSYAHELGLTNPQPGELFDRVAIEFFTKLEPKDRLLSWQEASTISGLTANEFETMVELAYDTALALYVLFAERQIELWDGKVEMVADDGKIALADSVGPDELRLIYKGHQLSKETIRIFYRGTPWEKALKQAQEMARLDNSKSWKEIAVQDLGAVPQPLPPAFKSSVDKLYGVLCNHLLGQQVFPAHPELDQFVQELEASVKGSKQGETQGAAR